jgi:hypothetical protein
MPEMEEDRFQTEEGGLLHLQERRVELPEEARELFAVHNSAAESMRDDITSFNIMNRQ